jgi:hypothetical protein
MLRKERFVITRGWNSGDAAHCLSCIYIITTHLWLNLAGVAREERQEALGARVDDVDLVEGDGVHHLLALL